MSNGAQDRMISLNGDRSSVGGSTIGMTVDEAVATCIHYEESDEECDECAFCGRETCRYPCPWRGYRCGICDEVGHREFMCEHLCPLCVMLELPYHKSRFGPCPGTVHVTNRNVEITKTAINELGPVELEELSLLATYENIHFPSLANRLHLLGSANRG